MESKEKLIFDEIIKVFGSQKACADALEMSEANFSHNLKRLTPKFIARLKSVGVNIEFRSDNFSKPNDVETNILYLVNELRKKDLELKELQEKYNTLKKEQK